MNLILDIGNSSVKAGVFRNHELIFRKVLGHREFIHDFPLDFDGLLSLEKIRYIGVVSVGDRKLLDGLRPFRDIVSADHMLILKPGVALPFENKYNSPSTLGMDRLALVAGAMAGGEQGAKLVVDAGTALTYDYLDEKNNYLGGAISPGLSMRFAALNHFTSQLPHVQSREVPPVIGRSTEESIRSGVLNGMIEEINGMCQRYNSSAQGKLKIYLSGGDSELLVNHLKNINFADPNLLLRGINTIIQHNFSQ